MLTAARIGAVLGTRATALAYPSSTLQTYGQIDTFRTLDADSPLVKEYGYLQTSQVFFLLCASHSCRLMGRRQSVACGGCFCATHQSW